MRTCILSLLAVALCTLQLACTLPGAAAVEEKSHDYEIGQEVVFWVNKVGPYNNPQETYPYYSLPFCKVAASGEERKWAGLGEALQANELTNSRLDIQFRKDMPSKTVCKQALKAADVSSYKTAIYNHYWFQAFIDDLPIWALVGQFDLDK